MLKQTEDIEVSELEKHFNTFYMHFLPRKCTSYPDMLVYKVGGLMANDAAKDANELIKRLNLPLKAKSNNTGEGLFNDSIIITSINDNTI